MCPASAAGMSTRLDRCAPTATNTASNAPSRRSSLEVLDPVVTGEPHPERGDPIHLRAHHVPRQPVGGNPVAHHPARLGAGIANLDLVAEPREVVGGRQAARTRADHQHALAAPRPRGIEQPRPLEREITEEPLDRVNRQRAVELGAVAHALTRVVADPSVDRGERVLGGQQPPRLLVLAGLDVRHPALDVLARGAARIAGWEQIDVHRSLVADGPGPRLPVGQVGQPRDIRGRARHRGDAIAA